MIERVEVGQSVATVANYQDWLSLPVWPSPFILLRGTFALLASEIRASRLPIIAHRPPFEFSRSSLLCGYRARRLVFSLSNLARINHLLEANRKGERSCSPRRLRPSGNSRRPCPSLSCSPSAVLQRPLP